jgi:hypothetical protein
VGVGGGGGMDPLGGVSGGLCGPPVPLGQPEGPSVPVGPPEGPPVPLSPPEGSVVFMGLGGALRGD